MHEKPEVILEVCGVGGDGGEITIRKRAGGNQTFWVGRSKHVQEWGVAKGNYRNHSSVKQTQDASW